MKRIHLLWKGHTLLILIILGGFMLRSIAITQPDILDDEAWVAVQAIGPLDYFESFTLLSPVQLIPIRQWWQNLAFYDHPPLVFWIVHVSIQIFGQNPLGVRLPSLVAGTASILLLYLVTLRMSNDKRLALATAGFLAISNSHVWASRVAFLESIELFFMLATFYCVVEALHNRRWWILAGFTLGCAMLSKHFAILIVPAIIALIWYRDRNVFRTRWPYLGLVIFFIISSPILIYNIALWHTFGHLDSGISSILGVMPNEYIQTHPNRTLHMPNFMQLSFITYSFSWIETLILILGSATAWLTWKRIPHLRALIVFTYTYAITLTLLFASMPLRKHYLVLICPLVGLFLAILWTLVLSFNLKKIHYGILGLVAGLAILFQTTIVIHSQIIEKKLTASGWFSTQLQRPQRKYAYLDIWLDRYYTEHTFRITSYGGLIPQLQAYQNERYNKLFAHTDKENADQKRTLIVYDTAMDYAAVRWTFLRRKLYDLQPIMLGDSFMKTIRDKEALKALEIFDEFIIIVALPTTHDQELQRGVDETNFYTTLPKKASATEFVTDAYGKKLFAIYTIAR